MINSNEKFTYFDELRIFQRIYNADLCTKNGASSTSFVPRNVFYRISTPFLMDSQTTNWLNEKLGIEKKRNRKRKHKEIAEYIGEDVQFVKNVYTEFQSTMRNTNECRQTKQMGERIQNSSILSTNESTLAEFEDIGNKLARECVKNAPNFHPITTMGDGIEIMDIDEDKNIFSTKCEHPILWRNGKAEFIQSKSFLFPPNSAFLHSDISLSKNLPKYGFVDFDFIILDPSWPNRTVKRQKSYETIKIRNGGEQFEKISKIPIENLLKSDGILCIWMTNSQTSRKKADELIEHWGLRKLAKWNWLKICKTGDPICPFQAEHKMPFESFLLACKPESIEKYSSIPKEHCLISVPNANPSRKPPISKLLEEVCLIEAVKNGLELFGRYLLPNFITIGFEAAKFQNEYYFEESIK